MEMRKEPMRHILLLTLTCLSVSGVARPVADRTVRIDDEGVMRWADDGGEVAVFGVNYYTPFALDYRVIGERGYDRKETIRRDVAHFRRLGLTAMRLHCFDREISNREGALIDNDHLDLLDYLIAECASNGIYTVLTPIAGWGGKGWTSMSEGFSTPFSMRELTADRALWKIQARYEEEFARHVNRYTGRRYADDPAVLCFELINEPAYTNGTPDKAVAEFTNVLLDGIRRSGTTKPVLYSATWNGRRGSIPNMRTDGVTGVYYATGLRAGGALPGTQLNRVRSSSLKPDERIAKQVKVIYEFDAADTVGAYMYPAMAAVFRSEGVQSATQFQYDPTPIADSNDSYKTHYLNLVYTPEKAISMAIAAEVFRRVPRGTPYAADKTEVAFAPFRVNAKLNLSEMVTETALYYTSTPISPAPSPERLERVWGCGTSSVVTSTGNGAYFLDRIRSGLWRLQVYPSVRPIADPYTGLPGKKTVVLPDQVTLTIALPDLGGNYAVFRTSGGARVGCADGGRVTLSPGDYVLTREADPTDARLESARQADVPAFCAPQPDPPGDYRPWPLPLEERTQALKARFRSRREAPLFEKPVRLQAKDFKTKGFFDARRTVDADALNAAFPQTAADGCLVVCGRGLTGRHEPVELAFTMSDGMVWGVNVTLPEHPSEVRVPLSALTHFRKWDLMSDPPKGTVPDGRDIVCVSIAIGGWLDEHAHALPHGMEITSLRFDATQKDGQ